MWDDPEEVERELDNCKAQRRALYYENTRLRVALQIAQSALEWIAADNLHGGHRAVDADEYMYGHAANTALEQSRKALEEK